MIDVNAVAVDDNGFEGSKDVFKAVNSGYGRGEDVFKVVDGGYGRGKDAVGIDDSPFEFDANAAIDGPFVKRGGD